MFLYINFLGYPLPGGTRLSRWRAAGWGAEGRRALTGGKRAP